MCTHKLQSCIWALWCWLRCVCACARCACMFVHSTFALCTVHIMNIKFKAHFICDFLNIFFLLIFFARWNICINSIMICFWLVFFLRFYRFSLLMLDFFLFKIFFLCGYLLRFKPIQQSCSPTHLYILIIMLNAAAATADNVQVAEFNERVYAFVCTQSTFTEI